MEEPGDGLHEEQKHGRRYIHIIVVVVVVDVFLQTVGILCPKEIFVCHNSLCSASFVRSVLIMILYVVSFLLVRLMSRFTCELPEGWEIAAPTFPRYQQGAL